MKKKIYIKDFLNSIQYKIGEVFEFGWSCYGPNCFCLCWEEKSKSATLCYDSKTQFVYELSVWDDELQKVYRWIDPKYLKKHKKEALSRDVDHSVAYDFIRYEDLSPTKIINKLKSLQI